MLVGTGGTLAMTSGSNYTQTGGTTTVNGALQSAGTGNLNLQAGVLQGTGTATFATVTISGGQVDPGVPGQTGTLSITGNYTQDASVTLNIRLGGTAAGQFDQLAVSGVATLGGTLTVTLVNSFSPSAGNSFEFMTFGSRSGTSDFATKNLPTLGGGLTIKEQTNSTNALLTVSSAAATTVTNVTSTTANGTYGVGATITITVALQRGGDRHRHAATGAQLRRHGELHQRQRDQHADLHLHRGRGPEQQSPGLHQHHRPDAQRRHHRRTWLQPRRAHPAGPRLGRLAGGQHEHRHRHHRAHGDRRDLDDGQRHLRRRRDDHDHRRLQRDGDRHRHAATGAQLRRHGELQPAAAAPAR